MLYIRIMLLLSFSCLFRVEAQPMFEVLKDADLTVLRVRFDDSELNEALQSGTIQAATCLQVYIGVQSLAEAQQKRSILGTYTYSASEIRFRPLLPFRENIPYLAVFQDRVLLPFRLQPPVDRLSPQLLGLYPGTDTVPANLLKIYLHFSEPMQEGQVYDRVYLLDAGGNRISEPFVRLQPELWDETRCRVTLWLDPGRVKRALMSRERFGAVLAPGQQIRIRVDSAWKSAAGYPLNQHTQQQVYISSADRERPLIQNWHLTLPAAGTKEALEIVFWEPMDQALAMRSIEVLNAEHEQVAGTVSLVAGENSWQLIPHDFWQVGTYQIRVASILEDLAGNNLNRLFDRDLSVDSQAPSEQEFYLLEFEIKRSNQ